MKFGVYVFATDLDMGPGLMAREVEARGLDSMFFPEHSHIPVARTTPYPDSYGGGTLPDFYKRTHDPFISASLAAAATTRLEVGTGVALLALRDTVHTAKLVSSVDNLSGGRFTFGVGFGWNADEFATHCTDFRTRHRKVREQVAALRMIWANKVAEYHGEFVNFEPLWQWPKPAQKAGPPVYLGGSGPLTMRHAAEWADCWYPTPPMADPLLEKAVPAFRELVAAAGRDPDGVLVGSAPAEVTEHSIEAYERNGVAHVNAWLCGGSRDETLTALDRLAAIRSAVLGDSRTSA